MKRQLAGKVPVGRHSATQVPKHERYRLMADTKPWHVHPWRYRLARLALAALDLTVGIAISAVIIAAGGGLYLALSHRPLPAPIARMVGSHASPARVSVTHAPTPSATVTHASKIHHA